MFLGCSTPELNDFERLAREKLSNCMDDYFQKDEKVTPEDVTVKYLKDSLCILHFEIKDQSSGQKKQKYEYILLSDNSGLYYSFNKIGEDDVYFEKEKLDSVKNKNSTLYIILDSMDYDHSIMQRSVENINWCGKKIGYEKDYFSLVSPSKYGLWHLTYDKDEFGDNMVSKSLLYLGQGSYYTNNLYEGNFSFSLTLSLSDNSLAFSLFQDRNNLIVQEGVFILKIKDFRGEVYKYQLESGNGFIATWGDPDTSKEIFGLLKLGQELNVAMYAEDDLNTTYKLKVNPRGYSNFVSN